MGLGNWLGQKAGLAWNDIQNLPGATMRTAQAVDPSMILGELLSGQKSFGNVVHNYVGANKSFIGGTANVVRHPLRDPFQTALLVAPFAKGLRFESPAMTGEGQSFESVSGFKSPAHMIRAQIERDNPGAFKLPPSSKADLIQRYTEQRLAHNHGVPEPPANTNDVIQEIANKLGLPREHVERQVNAADQFHHNITNDVIGNIARKRGGSLEQRVNAHFNAQPARGIHFSDGGHKLTNTSYHSSPEFAFKAAAKPLEDPRSVLLKQLMQRRYKAQLGFHHN